MASNRVVGAAVFGTVLILAAISLLYVQNSWRLIDKKLFTMMAGLAVVPSLGVLVLDLLFSKNLGKSSYVFFAGPAIAYLLTLATGNRREPADEGSRDVPSRLAGVVGFVLPVFIGLQLTGINFGLERTPGFAGSTLRSLAGRIEASSPTPMVVIGAGHGRGDPATLIYELAPDADVERLQAAARLRQSAGDDISELEAAVAERPEDTEAQMNLAKALAARSEFEPALDKLLAVVARKGDSKEEARQAMVDIFEVLGNEHPLTATYRRQLATALN